MPVLPDSNMWKYPCAQVIFDSDPAPAGVKPDQQMEQMGQAMIRGVMDESGEQFVAYFLPTDDTLAKRGADQEEGVEYTDEAEYEYRMAREYNWNVKSKASKGYEENFFFLFREDGVFYNELETRVRLSKRRLKAGQAISNSKLAVRHRPLKEEEQEAPKEGGRSRSASKSKSRSASRSKSRSRSRSKSRSASRSVSRSKSRSVSRSKSRSASRSKSRSKSKSKSKSRSVSRSKSRSKSKSKSKSPA